MILDLDMGNSRIKWRMSRVDGNAQLCGVCVEADELISRLESISREIERVRVSCVAQGGEFDKLSHWFGDVTFDTVVPVRFAGGVVNGYENPEQLGADRWAAICAAHPMKDGPDLVVDAGSALTLDFVTAAGIHQGGYILPGPRLMADSLLGGTEKVRFDKNFRVRALGPGNNTQKAVSHGVLAMVLSLIENSVMRFDNLAGDTVNVWLTGGDAEAIGTFLKIPHIIVPDLVFRGIEILLP